MNTLDSEFQELIDSLADKEYRDLYLAATIREDIALQIRAMREHRGWTQSELGERAGMAQEVICKLEDPDYGRPTITTLKRLASAFDVALVVRFAPFSHLASWVTNLSPSDLAVPSFEEDRLSQKSSYAGLPLMGADGYFTEGSRTAVVQEAPVSTGNVTDITEWRPGHPRYSAVSVDSASNVERLAVG